MIWRLSPTSRLRGMVRYNGKSMLGKRKNRKTGIGALHGLAIAISCNTETCWDKADSRPSC